MGNPCIMNQGFVRPWLEFVVRCPACPFVPFSPILVSRPRSRYGDAFSASMGPSTRGSTFSFSHFSAVRFRLNRRVGASILSIVHPRGYGCTLLHGRWDVGFMCLSVRFVSVTLSSLRFVDFCSVYLASWASYPLASLHSIRSPIDRFSPRST